MDPSSSFESQASTIVVQHEIICVDPDLYKAAAEGKIDAFKDKTLDSLLTPNKNTVLHIYLTATKEPESTGFVEEILIQCPSLLWQKNTKEETPLHMAARYGHSEVVDVLINRAKHNDSQDLESGVEAARRMIRMANIEKNTALHEAARHGKLEVVKLLTKEDPHFVYAANDADETPLFLAAESGSLEVVSEILHTCNSPAHSGPLGRTALHAAVYWHNEEMIRKIVETKGANIMKEADQEGWTPLHYAAYCGSYRAIKVLLELDRKLAYMKDKEGRTALHIAVDRGYNEYIMKEIVSRCPDCCEIV